MPSGEATPIPFNAHVEEKIGPRIRFEYPVEQDPVRAQQIRYPVLSPDGARLAFTALDRVWIMDYPNGKPRRAMMTSCAAFACSAFGFL